MYKDNMNVCEMLTIEEYLLKKQNEKKKELENERLKEIRTAEYKAALELTHMYV